MSAFVQLFEALGSLRGRAVARDAQKISWVGMFLKSILLGDGLMFPTLSSLYSSYLRRGKVTTATATGMRVLTSSFAI